MEETVVKGNMVLADLCQYLGDDWEPLALRLGLSEQDVNIIKQEVHTSPQRTSLTLKLWRNSFGPQATGNILLMRCFAIFWGHQMAPLTTVLFLRLQQGMDLVLQY